MAQPLSGRIALVTGASRGIGHATGIALARAGAHVVAVARTVGGLEELDDAIQAAGSTATLVPLDMRDYGGLYRLAAALNERHGRLDALVGNAAIAGVPSPLDHIEPKAWDEAFAINVTANWHLIRAMDPLLRRSDAGRAVFVTSRGALLGVQGSARCAGAHLCGRDEFDPRARQSVRSRRDAHAHARGGDARRRSDDLADAGGRGGEDRRSVPAKLCGDRQALRIPQ
jgi:NAD(P)-dependent dehydrogenase (short-subunit alcohol dehydrogenase family)